MVFKALGFLRSRGGVRPEGKKSHSGLPQGAKVVMTGPGQPVWTPRRYDRLAEEAYMRNVIAFRSVSMIAQAAASVPWLVVDRKTGYSVSEHPVLRLLEQPNPVMDRAAWIEAMVSHRLIGGNAFLEAVGPADQPPMELYVLRPDRVQVLGSESGDGIPCGYRYVVGNVKREIPVNRITGRSRLLHWRHFHPLSDWVGMSPIEAAAYAIDQHNQASVWNQALLQNGARPSGALVVGGTKDNAGGHLSEEQYSRLKGQIDEQFSGASNAGRPILLEGGLEWKEMSLNPKDMDFLNSKHSSARDIALAFGVPPQLLGIPGDNTYNNLAEARLALWEQTVLPLVENLAQALNGWLLPYWGSEMARHMKLEVDTDEISALTPRRDAYWARVEGASFLSEVEKRELLGF